jgi:hypothetical protein
MSQVSIMAMVALAPAAAESMAATSNNCVTQSHCVEVQFTETNASSTSHITSVIRL